MHGAENVTEEKARRSDLKYGSLDAPTKVFMIQEIVQARYRGVLCSRCKERIPVPKRVSVLYEELKHGEATDGQDVKSRAFTLRCKA